MKHSNASLFRFPLALIWPAIILLPMILGLLWGAQFEQDVYALLRHARELGNDGFAAVSAGSVVSFPLSALFLAPFLRILAQGGLEQTAVLLLSALGWSATAVVFIGLGQTWRRPDGAFVAALLLAFNPAIITTLGAPASWLLFFCWLLLLFVVRRRMLVAAVLGLAFVLLLLEWPPGISGEMIAGFDGALAWSAVLLAIGVTAEWFAGELSGRDLLRLPARQTPRLILAVVFVGLAFFQCAALWRLYESRPLAHWELE